MSLTNNKRIAKNTLILYFRMFLTMGVSLFTVRVVLDTIGVVDYGIYNVVGGIVIMFSFLSNTMASASQRYFSFEIGRSNYVQLKRTFAMTMTIYVVIAVLILLLAETVGLWFLNHKMTIPVDRMEASRWVYQFSILSFMMTMFTVPYNAAIIAHENMKIYAWVSVIEVLLKLGIVYMLVIFNFDKLKLYAVLMFSVTALVTLIYRIYCSRNYKETKLSFYWDKSLFKELISFSGWNLFGALAGVFDKQGINIVLNMFFGPTVNAARGIAFQISTAINQFVLNFLTATRPQIIKYYAEGENKQMIKLVFQSSKLSYFLLFIISMPVILELEFIFNLWLKDIPDYTILFTRLIIINVLIETISYPLMTAAQATGKIRIYQSSVGGVMLLNLPISYVFLRLGYPPETIFYLAIVNSIVCLHLRLILLRKMIGLSFKKFMINVVFPVLYTSIAAYFLPLILINSMDKSIVRFFTITFVGGVASLTCVFILGLSKGEKDFFLQSIKNYKNVVGRKKNSL